MGIGQAVAGCEFNSNELRPLQRRLHRLPIRHKHDMPVLIEHDPTARARHITGLGLGGTVAECGASVVHESVQYRLISQVGADSSVRQFFCRREGCRSATWTFDRPSVPRLLSRLSCLVSLRP